jgi:hypothetical protein
LPCCAPLGDPLPAPGYGLRPRPRRYDRICGAGLSSAPFGQAPAAGRADSRTRASGPPLGPACRVCGGGPAAAATVRGRRGLVVRLLRMRGPFLADLRYRGST